MRFVPQAFLPFGLQSFLYARPIPAPVGRGADISLAVAIARGELVAMPTETVYGLAGDAAPTAHLCGRAPADHPPIVHLARPNYGG
jgi:hypothetical protein